MHSDAKAMTVIMGMMDSIERHKEILTNFHYIKTNMKTAHMLPFSRYIIIWSLQF